MKKGELMPPETPAEPTSGETPRSLADSMKDALRELDAESGLKIGETAKTTRARKATTETEEPAPKWTAKGIGSVWAAGHDLVFDAYQVALLEPEEREQLAQQAARFLNAIWPEGGRYEPHAAFVLSEIQVAFPRIVALQMRRRQEQEAERLRQEGGPRLEPT